MKAKIMLWVLLAGLVLVFGMAAMADDPYPICPVNNPHCTGGGVNK